MDQYYSTKISSFLKNNSEIRNSRIYGAGHTSVSMRTEYRPDKVFGADKYMKWKMILAGVDSPWQLVRGSLIPLPDTATLSRELDDLSEDFHI